MFAILAILACLAGVFFLALAWLSGHRTIIPMAIKPVWFWLPGLVLLLASPIVAMGPSVVVWNNCSGDCTMSQPEVKSQYDACVLGARASVAKGIRKDESLSSDQVTARVAAQLPDIEAQCDSTITNKCTTACFDAWWNPQVASPAEAPE